VAVMTRSGTGAAQAQATTTVRDNAVEEVIVTAQKRAERLQDVPLAITAITSQSLERSGALSLRDVVALAPSLAFSQSQSPVQSNIAIRGVGSSGGVGGMETSGFDRQRGGFLTNDFNSQDVNDLKAYGVRGRLLWTPTAAFDAIFTYENHRTVQNCCAAEFSPLSATQAAIGAALGKPFPAVID